MDRRTRYSPEVRERAVRMVFEHEGDYYSQWLAIASISQKFGCSTETLRRWVRQAETDRGRRADLSTERENYCRATGLLRPAAISGAAGPP